MKFIRICLVVMGNIRDIVPEIVKVSDSDPNIFKSNNLMIATFSTAVTVNELQDYFKLSKRNFILFEMEKGLVKRELERVVDFANLAMNKTDTYETFKYILDYYRLNLYDL